MRNLVLFLILASSMGLLNSCNPSPEQKSDNSEPPTPMLDKPIRVILDTDANNELDDQHAIAYMLFSPDAFEVAGITVNATFNGGGIESHVREAIRIVELCGKQEEVRVIPGAAHDYEEILPNLDQADFEGHAAVDFIIREALKDTTEPLFLVPIGTLTNVALAIKKAPAIIPYIKIMWLGSNWPDPGEYNLDNDTTSVNPVLNAEGLDVQICTVRYGEPSGTAAVTASVEEIRDKMKGLGPQVEPVFGRHGGSFTCFGDYSIDLFANIGDEERALFDVCALAILKNPDWAEAVEMPAPQLAGNVWQRRPLNKHKVVFWENFNKEAILNDFYTVMNQAH